MSQTQPVYQFTETDFSRIDGHDNFMIPIYNDWLGKISMQRVVDVGCGNGLFTADLKKMSPSHLVGVDASDYALGVARERGFDETVRVTNFDTDALPLVDKSVNLAICKDVLEHLLNPVFLLEQIKRILTDDGHVFVLVPNHFPLRHRLHFLFDNKIDTQNFFPDANEWDFPHIRFYTMNGFSKMLKKAGFEIVASYNHLFSCVPVLGKFPGGKALVKKLCDFSPSNFSTAFAVLCQKSK